jgi:hypothetical protein
VVQEAGQEPEHRIGQVSFAHHFQIVYI